MYLPASFQETRIDVLHELIHAHPLGLLVTTGAKGIQASPLPFLLHPEEGSAGVLRAHMARANPHWQDLAGGAQCLVAFQGPQGYVSPSWYPGKAQTHRAVPTWNYATVQVRGTACVLEDTAWLRQHLQALTGRHEQDRQPPWTLADAPEDFIAGQMKAIVGIEIGIACLEGKFKMSQNRTSADRIGVLEGIGNPDDPHFNADVAGLLRRTLF